MKTKMVVGLIFLGIGIWAGLGTVWAVDYPTREIELICAFAPGSNSDTFARLTAKLSEKYIGKPVLVINKTGGSGVRGYTAVATAKPDGYTIGTLSPSAIAQPYLVKGVTFKRQGFKAIAQTDLSGVALIAKKGGPYDIPLKDLVKKSKEKNIKVAIAATWGSHDFLRAIFEDESGAKFLRVPFPTAAEAGPALLGGHVDLQIGAAAEWAGLYQGGKVKVLALSLEQRDPRYPEIPTFRDFGYDVVLTNPHWIVAPAGTPEPIVHFLAEAMQKAVAEPAFKETAESQGGVVAWEGPAGAAKAMEKMEQQYLKVIKKYDLKPQ